MKPGAAVSRTGSAVAFSWEQEPGVSKQSHKVEANKPAALCATANRKATATEAAAAAETTAHSHRLRVPPPPGRSRPRSRGARPENDPFLAAYLACTERGGNGRQKLVWWTGLGVGLSCKSSSEAVESSMLRLVKMPPKFARND